MSGLSFGTDPDAPEGSRVASVELADGTKRSPGETYTVATDELMAAGGNGFEVFAEGENHRRIGPESEALVRYFEARGGGFVEPPDPLRERRKG